MESENAGTWGGGVRQVGQQGVDERSQLAWEWRREG